jgi:heme exporter protein CcmD
MVMSHFFNMGGYAFYIWSSWIIGMAILIAITWHSLSHARSVRNELDALEHPKQQRDSDA